MDGVRETICRFYFKEGIKHAAGHSGTGGGILRSAGIGRVVSFAERTFDSGRPGRTDEPDPFCVGAGDRGREDASLPAVFHGDGGVRRMSGKNPAGSGDGAALARHRHFRAGASSVFCHAASGGRREARCLGVRRDGGAVCVIGGGRHQPGMGGVYGCGKNKGGTMVEKEIKHFNLEQICDSGQCFRMKKMQDNVYVVLAKDRYIKIEQEGDRTRFYCSEEEFLGFWKEYFDLDNDYVAYMAAANPNDRYLNRAIAFGSGMRILRQDLWEMIRLFPHFPAEQYRADPPVYRGTSVSGTENGGRFPGISAIRLQTAKLRMVAVSRRKAETTDTYYYTFPEPGGAVRSAGGRVDGV